MSKSMISFAMDVAPSMLSPLNNDVTYSKLDLTKALVTHFITKERLRSKTCQYQILTYGDVKTNNFLNSNQGEYYNVNEIEAFREADVETIVKVVNEVGTKQTSDCKTECTPVDAVGVSLDALIRINAGKKFNKLIFLFTDAEFMFHQNDVEDLEAMVHSMIHSDIQLHFGIVGNKTNQTVYRKENITCLRDAAQKTGGSLVEIENLVDSFYLFGDKRAVGTKPTMSKIKIELSPSVHVPVVTWTRVMACKPPVMNTALVKATPHTGPDALDSYSSYDYVRDDDGIFSKDSNKNRNNKDNDEDDDKNAGIVRRDTVYVRSSDIKSDDPRIFEAGELIKGFRYGQTHIPANFSDDFIVEGKMKIQILGYVEAFKVPLTSHIGAPIIVQGEADTGAVVGSYNLISQQVVYILAQAMAETETVAVVRYVKKDDADPQVMVMRPNLSDNDATLNMYRIPFKEDSNQFIFPSLSNRTDVANTTASQRNAMSVLVDSMTLIPTRKRMTPHNSVMHNIFRHIQNNIISDVKSIATILESLNIDPFDTISVYNNNNNNDGVSSSEQKLIGEHINKIFREYKLHKKNDKKEIKKQKWTDFVASKESFAKELKEQEIVLPEDREFDVNQGKDSAYIARRVEMLKTSKKLPADFDDFMRHYLHLKKDQIVNIFNELKIIVEERVKKAFTSNSHNSNSEECDDDTLEEILLLFKDYSIKTDTSNDFNIFLKRKIQPLLIQYHNAHKSLSQSMFSQCSQSSQFVHHPTLTGSAKVFHSLKRINLITDGGNTNASLRDAWEYSQVIDD